METSLSTFVLFSIPVGFACLGLLLGVVAGIVWLHDHYGQLLDWIIGALIGLFVAFLIGAAVLTEFFGVYVNS